MVVISTLTRKTALKNRQEWGERQKAWWPKIFEVLQKQKGFISGETCWNSDDSQEILGLTTWESLDACHDYVRKGGAATVAALEELWAPTAAYPEGTFVRKIYVAD